VIDKSETRGWDPSVGEGLHVRQGPVTCTSARRTRSSRRRAKLVKRRGDTSSIGQKRADCRGCLLKAQCCPKTSVRKIPRSIYEEASRRCPGRWPRRRLSSNHPATGKRVEMLFAHFEAYLGGSGRLRLARAMRCPVRSFTLAAIAQNLRRLAKLVARPPPFAPFVRCVSVASVSKSRALSRPAQSRRATMDSFKKCNQPSRAVDMPISATKSANRRTSPGAREHAGQAQAMLAVVQIGTRSGSTGTPMRPTPEPSNARPL